MNKWIKRFLSFLLVLTLGSASFLIVSDWLIHRTPSWYRPLAINSNEMEAAANRAFDKAVAIHNMAADAASQESSTQYAKDHGTTAPASKPVPPPITVSFTQEELT